MFILGNFFRGHDALTLGNHLGLEPVLKYSLGLHAFLVGFRDDRYDEVEEDHVANDHESRPRNPYRKDHPGSTLVILYVIISNRCPKCHEKVAEGGLFCLGNENLEDK